MTDITSQDYIAKQLQKLSITDVSIKELEERYLCLTINSITDKETYKVIDKARKHVKSLRVDVDQKRKELNADALKYQKAINAEAKRVTELLKPIETHLEQEQKAFDAEVERIKQVEAQKELEKIKFRSKKLSELGFIFNGEHWTKKSSLSPYNFEFIYSHENLISDSEDEFSSNYLLFKKSHEEQLKELEIIAQEEMKLQLEVQKKINEALELQRKEQEKERISLENERIQLAKLSEEMDRKESLIELKEKSIHEQKLTDELKSYIPDIKFPRDVNVVSSVHESLTFGKAVNVPPTSVNIPYELFTKLVHFLRSIDKELMIDRPEEIISDVNDILKQIGYL